MKQQNILFFILLLPLTMTSQPDLSGYWNGALSTQGMHLDISLKFTVSDDGWTCTIDVPLQGLKDFPATSMSLDENQVEVVFSEFPASYQGAVSADAQEIAGIWHQAGQEFPLDLKRSEDAVTDVRPQEPRPPYPYESLDVTFASHSDPDVKLAGTFTFPRDAETVHAVVLVSGSGPQDRNEELLGHKPFLVLSDYLTRRGIAVLRYDDRGFGESTGDRATSTTFDFAEDAKGAISFLKEQQHITCDKIGLVGHSEGGMVAAILGADQALDFIVMMAGPGTRVDELLIDQTLFMDRMAGHPEEAIELDTSYARDLYRLVLEAGDKAPDSSGMLNLIRDYYDSSEFIRTQFPSFDQFSQTQVQLVGSPWFRYFIRFVPQEWIRQISCPVLAINGSLDFQVPAEKNLRAIEGALIEGPCVDFEIRNFPGLNHLFQPAQTGHLDEYARIPITIDPAVLETIGAWVLGQ